MADLPLDLFKRIADRANDPMRRTAMAGVEANATPLDLGSLMGDFHKHAPPQARGLLGALGKMQSMFGGNMPGFTMMGPGGMMSVGMQAGPEALAPPPDEAELERAEAAFGQPLPNEVRQLYAIADGGFGPGDGLLPLRQLVKRYGELTREPYGPLGQDWPKQLLPLFEENPVLSCIDLATGEIVAWDPEEIEDEDSDEDWQRSFKLEHPNLAALMSHWLGERTVDEQVRDEMQASASKMAARGPSPVTGYPMQLDDPAQQAEAEISFLSYADPSLRADFGLPETGWEDEVRRRHGLL
jgi:hypothetical protein